MYPINEGFARTVVASFVAQLDPTLEEINDVKTAISEAVTNNITEYFIKRCKELNLKYDPYIYMYLFYLIKKYNDYDCCFSS